MKKIKIGFFDSGLGGITIFNETKKKIKADYVYLGDNKNAPYGIKDKQEVRKYIFDCVQVLADKGCNIIVIACNTATSIAIEDLRRKYPDICIIGTEPAIKVAIDSADFKRALICATSLTLREEKLKKLIDKLHAVDNVDMLALDCLVKFIESGNYIDNDEITKYLEECLKNNCYDVNNYTHVVLGCTHFPIVKKYFQNIFGENTKIIDGSSGIAENVKKHILEIDEKYFEGDRSNYINLVITKESEIFVKNFKTILGEMVDKVEVIC